jgi:3-deoxy-manno-octulosonate cytidylyltransferase (CMP-KDO synthetase)
MADAADGSDPGGNGVTGGGFRVVVPARYASTRLPAKPLEDIEGTPMIVRVVRQAKRSRAAEIVVAVDDPRVLAALEAHGERGVMTRPDHASGSDRMMEVVERLGWPDDAIVVNVQGDEPLIPPAVIDQVADRLTTTPEFGVATLCEPIRDRRVAFDPNVVKVVRTRAGRALYFSRAPIPWHRATFSEGAGGDLPRPAWWRHIGIYGYRVAALRRFCAMSPGELEGLEALEQLRLLENDVDILVDAALVDVPGGVDTPADLERVRALVRGR